MGLEWIIIKVRPGHPQSQGGIERSNQDKNNVLRTWMADTGSKQRSIGLNFVQIPYKLKKILKIYLMKMNSSIEPVPVLNFVQIPYKLKKILKIYLMKMNSSIEPVPVITEKTISAESLSTFTETTPLVETE
ncbi:hypothetical protein QE152_g19253 [Popillia japonica]|uniref:Integrase catalytic domain-containing protein n=1 Tax=Popillia japonica TaxID=7064 RepID=A0AAW1KPN8_POPJA